MCSQGVGITGLSERQIYGAELLGMGFGEEYKSAPMPLEQDDVMCCA